VIWRWLHSHPTVSMIPSEFPLQCNLPDALRLLSSPLAAGQWLIRIEAMSSFTGQLKLQWQLPESSKLEPWWCLPGAFYGQGCADTAVPVPRWGREAQDWVQPCWQLASDRLCTPLTAVLLGRAWYGLSADPHYRLRDPAGNELKQAEAHWGDEEPQLAFGFGLQGEQFQLSLHLPANEGPRVLRRQPDSDATEKQLSLDEGMAIEFTLRLWQAESSDPMDRRGIHVHLRELHQEYACQSPLAETPTHAEILDHATHGLLAWHWMEEPGYLAYTVAYDRCQEFNANLKNTTLAWHFEASGFVGAMQSAFALEWQSQQLGGDPEGSRAALKMMRRWCRDGVAPNGLFRGSFHPGKAWTPSGWVPNPAPLGTQNSDASGDTPFYGSCWLPDQNTLHARTAADAILYLSRYAALLGSEHEFYAELTQRIRNAVQSALRLQGENGDFGFVYDLAEDRIREWGGEAGMWWLPALGEAYDLFEGETAFQAEILRGMQLGGRFYAALHVQRCSGGAPEDIRLALSSESPQAGVMGFRHLHRLDPEGGWLEAWKDSADWLLSFQKIFNQRFSPWSILSAQNFRTCGAQNASTQNTQVHCYGLQCGGDLIRLSRELQDDYYAIRAHEHARYSWQMLSRAAGHWGAQRGMCTEQFYTNDWSIFDRWNPGPHHHQKGSIMGSSHSWCITFMLLSLEQLDSVGELKLG